MNTAKQLKYHCFAIEQQPLLTLQDEASRITFISRITFLSYFIEIYGAELTNGSILFIFGPLNTTYVSLIYDTLFNPHYLNFSTEFGQNYNLQIELVRLGNRHSKF